MAIELEPTRASQDDLRRLYLLAALVDAAEGSAGPQDSKAAAETIEPMFPSASGTLIEDIKVLAEDNRVRIHDSLAADPDNPPVDIPETTVETINKLRQRAKASSSARTAVLAPLVLGYMLEHPKTLGLTSTPTLREVGFTLLGEPLPDGSVEETLHELKQHGLIEASTGHQQGPIKAVDVTAEGRTSYRGGGPVFLPAQASATSSSVYNTTNNIGQVQGQNIVVGSQGQVQQTANLEISVTQAIEKLRMATESLHAALADHPEVQREVDERLDELDEAEKAGEKNRIASVASKLRRRASRLAEKTVDAGVAGAVSTTAQELIRLILPFAG